MKTFQVEFVNVDDEPCAQLNSELVEACSKYDAKRVIKRIHRNIEIKRITPYATSAA